jgi:hypothetical protein
MKCHRCMREMFNLRFAGFVGVTVVLIYDYGILYIVHDNVLKYYILRIAASPLLKEVS